MVASWTAPERKMRNKSHANPIWFKVFAYHSYPIAGKRPNETLAGKTVWNPDCISTLLHSMGNGVPGPQSTGLQRDEKRWTLCLPYQCLVLTHSPSWWTVCNWCQPLMWRCRPSFCWLQWHHNSVNTVLFCSSFCLLSSFVRPMLDIITQTKRIREEESKDQHIFSSYVVDRVWFEMMALSEGPTVFKMFQITVKWEN